MRPRPLEGGQGWRKGGDESFPVFWDHSFPQAVEGRQMPPFSAFGSEDLQASSATVSAQVSIRVRIASSE